MSKMSPRNRLLFLVSIIQLVLLSSVIVQVNCDKYPWSHCKSSTEFHTKSCSSVKALEETMVVYKAHLKEHINYVQYSYFFDTPAVEICDSQDLFAQLNITSCEHYFCDSQLANITIATAPQKLVTLHSRMRNYCQYCSRSDFVQFHDRKKNGECALFSFPEPSRCTKSSSGYPLIFSLLVKRHPEPYICKCSSGRYGFRCDAYSMGLIPLTLDFIPIFLSIVLLTTILFLFAFWLMPFLIVRTKNLCSALDDWKVRTKAFIELRLLIMLLLAPQMCFLALENIFNISNSNLFVARKAFGDGFFRALSFLTLLLAMFTLFTVWVKVLYQADTLNTAPIPIPFIVALAIMYLSLTSLFAFPLANIAKVVRARGVLNKAFFPLTIVSMLLFAAGFLIYGLRLFNRIRVQQRLTVFQLKFTRFMIILVVLLVAIAVQMIFVIIEFLASGSQFGLSYRLINFPLLDSTFVLVVWAIMYQIHNRDMLVEAYPLLDTILKFLSYSYWAERLSLYKTRREEEYSTDYTRINSKSEEQ